MPFKCLLSAGFDKRSVTDQSNAFECSLIISISEKPTPVVMAFYPVVLYKTGHYNGVYRPDRQEFNGFLLIAFFQFMNSGHIRSKREISVSGIIVVFVCRNGCILVSHFFPPIIFC